ncbi:MAG TPA: DMT family transporter [Methylomusa anaerophila]|uniref:Putative DMT superfamily transporter inner membrane protein n=1 Tax=Methylomusa anaerophila TaxID=1930071 RepID=A0A348AEK3_9FIRM|nr:DMT family transporter [Methylomusa anaerophila]BBB89501.1 putative DMT superfamily transporter inner membrane protein [Methylomusa anaerophila]HML90129.1 DMT family transporter [Methylomusa anaerophila]
MQLDYLKEKLDAYISLSLAMIIVGSSVVFGKMIIMKFPVFLASGLRFAIASAIICPIILIKEKGFPKITKRDWIPFFLMAFCGQFIFTVLMLVGLKYTQAMEAGIITSTTPAFMAVVSFLVLKEHLNSRQVIGVVLATLGVLVINGVLQPYDQSDIQNKHILGNLLIGGAVVGEAVFLLLAKKLTSPVSDLSTTGILSLLGVLMFLPFSLYESISFPFEQVSLYDWLYILYFGAIYTVVAYIFWFRGVKKVTGSTASVFTAIIPMSAAILSVVFLTEKFTLSHAMGIMFIIASILMTSLPKSSLNLKENG